MASHARSFRLYLPSAASSSKAQIPEIINSLQTSEKVLSIELMPSNSLDISAISKLHPTFCSVIWRHSERFNYKKPNEIEPLALSKHLLDSGHNVLLHLAGRYLKREEAVSVLDEAKRIGVRNIFALKGEYIKFFENCGKQYDFEEATDLIKFIKERYQDYFSICVAGYPDRHPRCETFEEDTQNLIKKIEAGGDFIITQAAFNVEKFLHFIRRCRQAEITIPILPGLWIFDSYQRLEISASFCKVKVDAEMWDTAEKLKSNPGALRDYGIDLTVKLARALLEDTKVVGVHLFSLNDLSVVEEVVNKL